MTLNRNAFVRQPLAPLGVLTIVALLGGAAACAALLALIGEMIVPLAILAVLMLIVTGIVFSGLRWTPLLGGLLMLGNLAGGFVASQYIPYHLTHPSEPGFFAASVIWLACAVLGISAGIGATVQNYRSVDRRAPGWLMAALTGLAGLIMGALLVSVLVADTAQANTVTSSAGGVPVVHMGPGSFNQTATTVPTGASLRLVDDGAFPHIIRNGQWDVNGSAKPASEPGAPTVQDLRTDSAPLEIGPFSTAGTYRLYCTIHPGMNLTVVVQ